MFEMKIVFFKFFYCKEVNSSVYKETLRLMLWVLFAFHYILLVAPWLPASLLLGSLDPTNKRDYNSAEGMNRPQQTEYWNM